MSDLKTVKGIGIAREKQFHKLGIYTTKQLLEYFPRTYEDRSRLSSIGDTHSAEWATVTGKVVLIQEKRPRRGLTITEIFIADDSGRIKLTWFNQRHKKNFFKLGVTVLAYGKVDYAYGIRQMNNPQTEIVMQGQSPQLGIIPIYPLVDGVSQYVVRQSLQNWFADNKCINEIIPPEVHHEYGQLSRYDALHEMHFPSNLENRDIARKQLAFEELFMMQAGLLLLRKSAGGEGTGIKFSPNGKFLKLFYENLPFPLTKDQERCLQEIFMDVESERPMQRLLQGDVGAGKTIVGAIALLKAVENGFQGALMAPTEILAKQHYETLCALYENLPIKVSLLTGASKEAQRKEIYEQVESGHVDILIGTHALIQDKVVFKKLAMVIIDEQHRFGVHQRAILQKKGMFPHVLVMTATPIPRTMALSIYGDLEVSSIKTLPPGRKPVKTYAVDSSYKKRLLDFFAKEMDKGYQVYVVCPLVEESETLDLRAAEEVHEELKKFFKGKYQVDLVHGRMKSAEKDRIMEEFVSGKTHLLVSTTVIEVGVNVPNATIMCIYGAERFGISQLHQLRGRVGRSSVQSYCILISDSRNDEARMRLSLLEKHHDGFVLAEEDLLLRGSGKFFGYEQHGIADLKVAHIIKDLPILMDAREAAKQYFSKVSREEALRVLEPELKSRFGKDFIKILYS